MHIVVVHGSNISFGDGLLSELAVLFCQYIGPSVLQVGILDLLIGVSVCFIVEGNVEEVVFN